MIARKVFFSFVFEDRIRAFQVRNSQMFQEARGFIDAAEFEKVKRKGDLAIKRWIDDQMHGTSVTVVLIGPKTDASKWVTYEIQQSIKLRMGLLGIHIHDCRDMSGGTIPKGDVPSALHGKGKVYDWVFHAGTHNIPKWIDAAAKAAGRPQ